MDAFGRQCVCPESFLCRGFCSQHLLRNLIFSSSSIPKTPNVSGASGFPKTKNVTCVYPDRSALSWLHDIGNVFTNAVDHFVWLQFESGAQLSVRRLRAEGCGWAPSTQPKKRPKRMTTRRDRCAAPVHWYDNHAFSTYHLCRTCATLDASILKK